MTEICSSNKSEKDITLGYISGLYGVKGMVKVYSFTGARENILKYKTWRLEKDGKTSFYKLEAGKKHGKGIVAKLETINDRDEAAKLIKANIVISRDELPKLPKGEYYWSDLIGLEVFNIEGKSYGTVDHLFETGANDVVVVKGEKEILIPFIQGDYIKQIDLEKGTILVDWPEEL
jgi:16S rRNA processing protein RimM